MDLINVSSCLHALFPHGVNWRIQLKRFRPDSEVTLIALITDGLLKKNRLILVFLEMESKS